MNVPKDEIKEAVVNVLSPFSEKYKLAMMVYVMIMMVLLFELFRLLWIFMSRLKEREKIWNSIQLGHFCLPEMRDKDYQQVQAWKAMIAYEKSNPLQLDLSLSSPSSSVFHDQIIRCYQRSLSCCYFVPEMWMEFIEYEHSWNQYLQQQQQQPSYEMIDSIVQQALSSLPDSVILHLAIADYYEQNGRMNEAIRVFEELNNGKSNVLGWISYQQFMRRYRGVREGREIFRRARCNSVQPELFIAAGTMRIVIICKSSPFLFNVFF